MSEALATTLASADRLVRVRDLLRRQNDLECAAVAADLAAYLDPHADISLDVALGLIPPPGAEHWRTLARRRIRDRELGLLCARFLPGMSISGRAAKVAKLGRTYGIRWRREDCHATTMPIAYSGTLQEHLYRAAKAADGNLPGYSQLRRIFAHELPPIDEQPT